MVPLQHEIECMLRALYKVNNGKLKWKPQGPNRILTLFYYHQSQGDIAYQHQNRKYKTSINTKVVKPICISVLNTAYGAR